MDFVVYTDQTFDSEQGLNCRALQSQMRGPWIESSIGWPSRPQCMFAYANRQYRGRPGSERREIFSEVTVFQDEVGFQAAQLALYDVLPQAANSALLILDGSSAGSRLVANEDLVTRYVPYIDASTREWRESMGTKPENCAFSSRSATGIQSHCQRQRQCQLTC